MRRSTQWFLRLLLVGSLTSVVLLLTLDAKRAAVAHPESPELDAGQSARWVTDATGRRFPVANYRRIVSCSSIADAVLPDLISTDRLVAVSRWYAENNPNAARIAEKPRLSGVEELEAIFALNPDLVIVSNYAGDSGPLERLRERGLRVFDLGRMLGKLTLENNLRDLSQLVGQPALGERLLQQFRRRMAQVAAHVPATSRKRAVYLNLYDTQLHGGTLGSSYYDVLSAAGLIDAAAIGQTIEQQGSQAWPRFRVEDVLVMAPDVIVTVRGKGAALCGLSGMDSVKACRDPKGVVELDEGLLNDPGPGMVAAAEAICDRVYPR